MGDDNLLGNIIGAGVTLAIVDRVLRPVRPIYRTRVRTRIVYRARRKKRN